MARRHRNSGDHLAAVIILASTNPPQVNRLGVGGDEEQPSTAGCN